MEMITKDQLNAEDVRELTERLLRDQLSLRMEGYKITTSRVLNVLLKAAVKKRSIEAVCADLTEVVDSNTLREALNRGLKVEVASASENTTCPTSADSTVAIPTAFSAVRFDTACPKVYEPITYNRIDRRGGKSGDQQH